MSMVAIANSISYSMDNSKNNSNNYCHRSCYSTNYQNYNANEYNKHKKELSNEDKENITKDIDNILNNIEKYSNDLSFVNRNTLFDFDTKIANKKMSTTNKENKLLSLIHESCESSNNIFYLGKQIDSNTTSINNLKPRIDVIGKKVVNEKTKGKITIKLMNIKDEYKKAYIINSKNFFKENINISDLIKVRKINDLTSDFRQTNNNEFLIDVIKSIKRHNININNNIDLNNISINNTINEMKSLRIQCCEVYGKIVAIKSIICSNDKELKKLSEQINDNNKSIFGLDKRFKEIQGYQTNTEEELPTKNDKIINKSNNLHNKNNINTNIQPIEIQNTDIEKAKQNIIKFEQNFEQLLNEFKKKYMFESKTYITDIIESIKSKVDDIKKVNASNKENLDTLLQVISECINKKIIDNLYSNNKYMQCFIKAIDNINKDHSKFITKTQSEFCHLENKYNIKEHLAYKYKEATEKLNNLQVELLNKDKELDQKEDELKEAKDKIDQLEKEKENENADNVSEQNNSLNTQRNRKYNKKKKIITDSYSEKYSNSEEHSSRKRSRSRDKEIRNEW